MEEDGLSSTIVEEGMDEAKVLLEGNFLIGLGRRELDGKVGVLVAQSVLVILIKQLFEGAPHCFSHCHITCCNQLFFQVSASFDFSRSFSKSPVHFDFVGDVQLSSSCFMIGQRQSTTASSGNFHCHQH